MDYFLNNATIYSLNGPDNIPPILPAIHRA